MIRQAGPKDCQKIAELALLLWTGHTLEALIEEFETLLRKQTVGIYIWNEDDATVAFAQCQLRCDYVQGSGSSPVGYLEGIYAKEEFRRQGIARELFRIL